MNLSWCANRDRAGGHLGQQVLVVALGIATSGGQARAWDRGKARRKMTITGEVSEKDIDADVGRRHLAK